MYKQSKAESKKQQRFFGMVHSVQKGELSPSKVGPAVRKAAKNTDYSDAEDFASTKHKNLSEKKGSVQMKYFEKNAAYFGGTKLTPKEFEEFFGTPFSEKMTKSVNKLIDEEVTKYQTPEIKG
jgi:hypothetical protein